MKEIGSHYAPAIITKKPDVESEVKYWCKDVALKFTTTRKTTTVNEVRLAVFFGLILMSLKGRSHENSILWLVPFTG